MESTCRLIGSSVTEGLFTKESIQLAPRHTHNITSWWITLMEYTIWSSSFKAIWWMDPKLFRVRAPRSDWGPIHNKDCCQVQGLNYRRLLAKQATVLYTSSPSLLPPPRLKRNKWAESTCRHPSSEMSLQKARTRLALQRFTRASHSSEEIFLWTP